MVTVERGDRPARPGAGGVRRRRAAARRRDRGGAGHAPRGRPGRLRRAVRAGPGRLRAPPRRRRERAADRRRRSRATPWPRSVARLARRGREELGAPDAELRATYDLRYAGQAFELRGGGGARARPRRPARARSTAPTREPLRLLDEPDASSSWSPCAWPRRCPAPIRRRRPGPSAPSAARARCGSAMRRPRRRCWAPAPRRSTGRRCSSCPAPRWSCPPGWSRDRRRRGGGAGAMSELDPIALQVMLGALRAACDEMGVVLVRSAHSANIKERRDASTALFDASGRMVMQAEHIPVHLGAMPSAVAAVLERGPRARRRLDPQRPVRRRHPPARHHRDLAGLRGRRAGGLRRQPRPPRRRGRGRAGQHAGRLAHARGRGRGDPAHAPGAGGRARPRPARRPHRADAQPAPARGRPARPAGRQPRPAPSGCARWPSGWACRPCARASTETLDYAERRTRARIAELDGRRARRACDVLEARRGRPRAAPAGHGARRRRWSSTSPAPPTSTRATSTARWR